MSVNLSRAVHVQNGRIYDGKAEQTHAEAITFDNTETDLVSENVEDAIKEVDAKTSGLTRITTLWTNPSPSASFSAQTITLNSADYDFYLCVFAEAVNAVSIEKSAIATKGKGIELDVADSGYTFVRLGTYVSDTSISFGQGYKNQNTDNTVCIPIAIYGIKLI